MFRIHMCSPDGTEHRVTGIYREVDPPRKLVSSRSWEADPDVKDNEGWAACLDQLANVV